MRRVLFIILIFVSIKVQAQDEFSLNNKGTLLMDEGKYNEAFQIFKKLTSDNPLISIYRYNKAICLFNLERFEESLAEYRILHKQVDNEPEYIFQIGNILERLNQLDSVEYYYTVASQLDRENYLYFFKRGTFYLKNNEYQKAVVDFNAALDLDPEHHNSLHNRGLAYYRLGKKDLACHDWCQASLLGNALSAGHLSTNCNTYPDECK